MIRLLNFGKVICYTKGDTFRLEVGLDDEDISDMVLKFIISTSENSAPVIEKTISAENGIFDIELLPAEKETLSIGEYLFKMKILIGDDIYTVHSGDFIVKWGE